MIPLFHQLSYFRQSYMTILEWFSCFCNFYNSLHTLTLSAGQKTRRNRSNHEMLCVVFPDLFICIVSYCIFLNILTRYLKTYIDLYFVQRFCIATNLLTEPKYLLHYHRKFSHVCIERLTFLCVYNCFYLVTYRNGSSS